LHKLVASCAERSSRGPPYQEQAAPTNYSSHQSMPMPCPAPRPVKYPSQWRGSAAAAASQAPEPQLHRQVVREQPAERPAAEQLQPIQEDGSGYMSTESDSDTETNDKALVWHLDAYLLLCNKVLLLTSSFLNLASQLLRRENLHPLALRPSGITRGRAGR